MSEQHEYCMVLSTAGTEKNRDEIIKGLLEGELAACIQPWLLKATMFGKAKCVVIVNGY